MSNIDQKIVDEIVTGIKNSNVAFLVGAGISAKRTSYVPIWWNLVNEILDHIAGPDKQDEVEYVMSQNKLLLNEVIFKIISEVLGINETASLLKCAIDTDSFNMIHIQTTYLSVKYGAGIITTNFDELLEKARDSLESDKLINSNEQLNVIKVHGTVSNFNLARFTVDNVFKPLPDEISNDIKNNFKGKLLVVMGYRGADTFDLMPLLADKQSRPEKIIWFTRNKNEVEVENNHELFINGGILLEGFFDEYLQKICENLNVWDTLYNFYNFQSNKRSFNTSDEWWKNNISLFFEQLPPEKSESLLFLWARILEHIKAYNISKNENNYAVLNAYASYVERNKDLVINYNCLYSKVHLLYAKRIAGINVSDSFPEVISQIETSLLKEYDPSYSYQLQKLLGWTYHQYAISLQNTNYNYFQAKLMLLNACAIRSKLNDPEYVFSLFQLFMNAYHSSKINNWEIDDLAPIGWRKWMIHEMEAYSKILKESYRYDLYSTNLHNLGFLYQYLDSEINKDGIQNREYLLSAIEMYEEALKIRTYLCDSRLVAQSIVRISQSYLLLIKNCENNELNEHYYSKFANYINNVESIYKRIPQENFRYEDLEQLKKEMSK